MNECVADAGVRAADLRTGCAVGECACAIADRRVGVDVCGMCEMRARSRRSSLVCTDGRKAHESERLPERAHGVYACGVWPYEI